MPNLFFINILITFSVIFLLIYVSTLHLFPKDWREKVNSNKKSLNPKFNNDSLTGIVIIILSAAMVILWSTYFYIALYY